MVRRRPTAPTAESLVLRLRFWSDATCASTACALPQAELQQPLGTSAKACGCVACRLGAPRIKLLTALPACPTLQRSQVKAFHQAAAAVAITHLRWHTARRRHAWHAHAQSMPYAATLSADGSERACCAGVCAGIPTPRPCRQAGSCFPERQRETPVRALGLWPSDWMPCALPAHTHAAQSTTQRRAARRVNGEEGSQRPLLVRAVLVAGSWASPCESGTRIESPQCHCVPAAHPRRRRAVADSRACFAASPQGHMCAFECSPSCTFYSTSPTLLVLLY
jgi:hypothetical protein